jgi:hypothetical protein
MRPLEVYLQAQTDDLMNFEEKPKELSPLMAKLRQIQAQMYFVPKGNKQKHQVDIENFNEDMKKNFREITPEAINQGRKIKKRKKKRIEGQKLKKPARGTPILTKYRARTIVVIQVRSTRPTNRSQTAKCGCIKSTKDPRKL